MNSPPPSQATSSHPAHRAQRVEVLDQELLRLRRWPNVTRLPSEVDVALVVRVCALLGRKPTVGFLVARMLDVPHARVGPLLARLYAAGCIDILRAVVAPSVNETRPPSGLRAAAVPDRRFIGLLWRLFAR